MLTFQSEKNQHGYTILEVMVFLSITGFLFISALTVMGGRQAQIQYRQSVNEVNNVFSRAVNDISTGFFPSFSFECSYNGLIGSLSIAAAPEEGDEVVQGARKDCVFIGKAISIDADGSELRVTTLAARRPPIGETFGSLDDYLITPVNIEPDVNLDVVNRNLWGTEVLNMYVASDIAEDFDITYAAYIAEQGSLVNQSLQSGTQPIRIIVDQSGGVLLTGSALDAADLRRLNQSESVVVCLSNESTSSNAVIILGEDGRQTSTRVDADADSDSYERCGF